MRRLVLAAAAALALAGVAEARPARDEPRGAAAQRAGQAAAERAGRAARRRSGRPSRRRSQPVLTGRLNSVRIGLPPGLAASPLIQAPSAAPAQGSTPPAAPGSNPPPPPPPAPPAGSGRSVQARTDDRDPDHLKLLLSRTTVLAGDVKVEFNNAFAEDPHDLVVERAGTIYVFPELGPGEVDRRTLALDAGEWRLRCTIPTHAERGMTAALTVTG